jgi:menaquinone-dependent protoporphyrinogen oxidase
MKVLVSAATRHGSTAEVARVLAADGLAVDVAASDTVAHVAACDAIVVSSGVYYGRWLPTGPRPDPPPQT